MKTLIIALIIALGAIATPAQARAAPLPGTIQFGRHFGTRGVSVYPVEDRFSSGKSPLYAAHFRHAIYTTYVTVALSITYGVSTELMALEHDYVDAGTDEMSGWMPKENLQPGHYVLTIRTRSRVLASGSFRVVRGRSSEDIGPCNNCGRVVLPGGDVLPMPPPKAQFVSSRHAGVRASIYTTCRNC